VIMRGYENRFTIMMGNRPLREWGKLLGDVPTACAILVRYPHDAQTAKEDKNKKAKSKPREPSTAEPAN